MSKTLAPMDPATAEKLLRHLSPTEALEAGILTPMAGTRPVRLFSLEEAESFLVKYNKEDIDRANNWAQINYVDPIILANWVAGVLGDAELSAALHEIADTREPFGYIVQDLKDLIKGRVEQAKQVLGVTEESAK